MTSKAESDYQLTVLDPSYNSNRSQSLAQCHSYSPDTVVPHCNPTTRLLSKLDKNSIIQLVIDWLNNSSNSISILPPILTNNPSSSSSSGEAHQDLSQQDLIAAKHLINNKTCNSFNQLFHLWNVSMRNPKVPKIRAIERILEVDWPKGFSYHMLAQIDGKYLTSSSGRTWNAIELIYSDENKIPSPSPTQLQQSFSSELSHYFSHHLHLYSKQHSPSSSSKSTNPLGDGDEFIHFRLVAAPSALDLSCPNPLHILMIPKSPFALVSGIPASNSSGGGASELRSMSFSALAQSMGSIGIRLPGNLEVKGSIGKEKNENKEIGNEDEEQEKLQKKKSIGTGGDLPELKGKDPMALRSILLGTLGDNSGSSTQGSIPLGGGGKSRGLKRGDLEENPLIHSEKRIKREDSISIRLDQNSDSSTALDLRLDSNKMMIERILVEKEENDVLKGFSREFRHPAQLDKERKSEKRLQWDRDREVDEVFGKSKKEDQDGDLPKVERIDYELHLPFPTYAPYHQPESLSTHLNSKEYSASGSISNREPIRLRLEGSHVLAGLRQLIHSGLDRRGPTEESFSSSSISNTNNLTGSGTSSESRNRIKKIQQEARGLPDWLTRVEGTKVVVGSSSNKKKK